jgi:predicted methyltransferase
VEQIKFQNSDLKEGEVAGILYLILNTKNLTNSELIRLTGLPKETLRKFKTSIGSMLVDSKDEKIVLKSEFVTQIESLKLKPFSWSIYTGENIEIAQQIAKIRTEHNLQPKREFDQFFSTPETTSDKLEIMDKKDQLNGKKIALLGDDDLVSVAIGLSGNNYVKVDVYEIDTTLIEKLKKIVQEKTLRNINYYQYDARKDPMEQFLSRYDVVVIDPPYTATGVKLFLNRAIQLLSKKEDGYIFLYFGNSFKSPEKFIKIQELIIKFGLVIEDKIDKFARYYGAESIGSASSLYILRTTPFTKPLESAVLPKVIYTFENEKEEKFPYVDHIVAKILDVPTEIIKSKTKLMGILGEFCNIHHLKVVDTKITEFKGGGLTITYVLANSNLVLHTWSEFKALHMDLITCSPIYRKDLLIENLSSLFKTSKIDYIEVQ